MNLQVLQRSLSPVRQFSLKSFLLKFYLCQLSKASCLALPVLLSPLWGGGALAAEVDPVPLQVTPFQKASSSTTTIAANRPQPKASVWSDVDVTDGGFKILMPGEIDRKVNLVQVNGANVEQTLLLATQQQHDAFYMVAWSDLSTTDPLDEQKRQQVLERTKQSFLKSFKGKLTEEINMQLLGNTGKQYVMTSYVRGNPFTITSRTYLVGQRLYHVLAAIPKRVETSLQGSTRGFLKSFRLRPVELSQRETEG